MESARRWAEFEEANPAFVEQMRVDVKDVAEGRCGWAEILRIPDEDLLGMARMAAAKLDTGRVEEAERMFWALTELDPFVAWFWLALGDARTRVGKTAGAIEAYSRCLQEARRVLPPSEPEIRTASLRRGKLLARLEQAEAAYEDFKTVLQMDTPDIADGEQALLAVQALVEQGLLPRQALAGLTAQR